LLAERLALVTGITGICTKLVEREASEDLKKIDNNGIISIN